MRNLITERYKDEYRAIRWEDLETGMSRARVARLEYRYMLAGEPHVRVYHAMGGEPLGSLAASIFEGPTRPGTPTSPESPGSSSGPDEPLRHDGPEPSPQTVTGEPVDDVAVDAEDAVFFSGFDEIDVRARVLPRSGSTLRPFPVDGKDRAFDPELKALRSIEHDVQTGVVPRGGSIRGAVGGAVCASCRYALQSMSETYGVDIRITQMFGSLPRREQGALVDAGKARLKGRLLVDAETGRPLLANDVLTGAREAQIQRSLSPRAMKRSFKGMLWRERSFRFGRLRLPRVSEGRNESKSPSPNPDATEPSPPQC
jgi:hypothetical protein